MAIADIITAGFGMFSSVNKVPTRGFEIGAAIITAPAILHYHTLVGASAGRVELRGATSGIYVVKGSE